MATTACDLHPLLALYEIQNPDTKLADRVRKTLDKSIASIIMKIKYNLRTGPAVRVDGFMMSLLNFLEFDQYPCVMYTAKFQGDKTISSKVEFIVTNPICY